MVTTEIKLKLTSRDLLESLKNKRKNLESTDSKSSRVQMIECCFFANHIPEWLWRELPKETKSKFKKKSVLFML